MNKQIPKLPYELMMNIFFYLPYSDIKTLCINNNDYQDIITDICNNQYFWQIKYKLDWSKHWSYKPDVIPIDGDWEKMYKQTDYMYNFNKRRNPFN